MLRTPLIRTSCSLTKFSGKIERFASSRCQIQAKAAVPITIRRLKTPIAPISSAILSSSSYATSSSSGGAGDATEFGDEGLEAGAIDNIYEAEPEFGVDTDDDHLRINLYPSDSDPHLGKLFNASTLQEIFDIISSIPAHSRTEKHSSQALISISNLQKYLYKICIGVDPDRDSENKALFVQKVGEHPVFKEIVTHLGANCTRLEDEPLAAALLVLKRLHISMSAPECQEMLMECRRRKGSLKLPALSRLTVCLRGESQALLVYEFLPSLLRYTETMDSDLAVRLVSISLKNIKQNLSQRINQAYRQRIGSLLHEKSIEFEAITLCKVLLCLYDTSDAFYEPDDFPSAMSLIRQVGTLLADRVSELDVLDFIILQRFLEFGPKEPRTLLDALNSRTLQLVKDQDDTPVIELLHNITPSVKTVASRAQVTSFAREHLNQAKNFESVSTTLAKILRNAKVTDSGLLNQYWSKAEECVRRQIGAPHKVLRIALDYMGFVRASNYNFRNHGFEFTAKQILYGYMKNYRGLAQPCLIHPAGVAKAFAFIVAFGSPYEPVFCEADEDSLLAIIDDQFADRFGAADWMTVGRGIEASMNLQQTSRGQAQAPLDRRRYSRRYLDQVLNFITILDERLKAKLEADFVSLSLSDLYLICKAQLCVKKGSSDSPIFQEALHQLTACATERPDLLNSRMLKNVVIVLLSTLFNSPELVQTMRRYIAVEAEAVSPDLVAKFVFLVYSLGYEAGGEDLGLYQTCYKIINKYWTSFPVLELLQAMQALCFYHALEPDLVHKVFSIDFLNQVDEDLAAPATHTSHALKLRIAFMQLNRAVCMELPEAQVPWFHEKFCEDLRSSSHAGSVESGSSSGSSSHIHHEVAATLAEVLTNAEYVQRDAVTPYAYTIDFLIDFDEKGRPIKKRQRKRSLFSFSSGSKASKASTGDSEMVSERVAVLVLSNRSYTRGNLRSMRGSSRLKVRHLEMLGYRVIVVDPVQWNSMYMSEQAVRNDFLEQSIYTRAEKAGAGAH